MSSSRSSGTSAASWASLTRVERDVRDLGRGHIAVAPEQRENPRAPDQLARHLEVERRQRQRLVVEHLDGRSACPNAMTGPKVGSSAMPTMSSCAFGRTIMGWTVTPVDACLGLRGMGSGDDFGGGGTHRVFRREVEAHAADIRLVDDVARQDLDDHRRAGAEERPRQRRRLHRRRRRAASAPSGSRRRS